MKNTVKHLWASYFDHSLDLRVRLFNILAMAGTLVSLIMALLAILNRSGAVNTIINFASGVLSFILLTYSKRTGRYQFCYMVTIVAIFLVLFPILYFSAGAYYSGMPCFFVFAVVFTIFMLEGRKAIFFSVIEIVTYTILILVAYFYPQYVIWYETDQAVMIDVIIGFAAVSVSLGVTMYAHFRLYNIQQKQLAEQNEQLERAGRQKSALLADVSHEIRTPLAVMSGYAQRARKQISDGKVSEETLQGLLTIQLEAQRLAELAHQLIYAPLVSNSPTHPEMISIDEVAKQVASVIKPILDKNGNYLVRSRLKDCPMVYANSGMLAQVFLNLCMNANRYTQNGEIAIAARQISDTMVQITVSDNGEGIKPELLGSVFDRGVSGDGKSGLGLSICKEVVEGHGGEISILPQEKNGTCVAFTLPIKNTNL